MFTLRHGYFNDPVGQQSMLTIFMLSKLVVRLMLQICKCNFCKLLCCNNECAVHLTIGPNGHLLLTTWLRNQMETFSALLAFCVGNSPVAGEFPPLMFPMICTWTNRWATNGNAGDFRCHRAHYDVIVRTHSSCQFVCFRYVDCRSLSKCSQSMRIILSVYLCNGPLTRYVKLQVAHAPGMPGTFSPAADFKGNR